MSQEQEDLQSRLTQRQQVTAGCRGPHSPVTKLSIKLGDTYKTINRVHNEKQMQKEQAKERILMGFTEGETIGAAGRYQLIEKIGTGSFGQAFKAFDTHQRCLVAVKIISNPDRCTPELEADILQYLNGLGPMVVGDQYIGDPNIVQLLAHFVYRDHHCLVFELLSHSLWDAVTSQAMLPLLVIYGSI